MVYSFKKPSDIHPENSGFGGEHPYCPLGEHFGIFYLYLENCRFFLCIFENCREIVDLLPKYCRTEKIVETPKIFGS